MKDAKDQVENDKHNIDEKTGNGVGEGDNKEGEKDLGDGGLKGGDVLGVDLHSKHNHKAVENENENKDEVGDVSEGLPDGENGQEVLKTIARVLGVGWLNDTVFGHILAKTGKVVGRTNWWRLEGKTDDVSQLGDDTIAGRRGFGKIIEDIFAFGSLEKLEKLFRGIGVVSFDSGI